MTTQQQPSITPKTYPLNPSLGFTMVEMIIVSVLLGMLALAMMSYTPQYFSRRRDSERKGDLHFLKIAFEDYANDHITYPDEALLQDCDSSDLSPYIKRVPCDPMTDVPYEYVLGPTGQSYQLFTNLENEDDADVTQVGCETGCGPGNAYNYGVAGGGAVVE